MKKKYVVLYENKVYEYDVWSACKAFIEGKKNVKYKSFDNALSMKEYIDEAEAALLHTYNRYQVNDVVYAFVQGAALPKDAPIPFTTYGAVLTLNGNIIKTLSGSVERIPNLQDFLPGELTAALFAIQYAIQRGYPRIIVVYNYLGTEMYANHSWRPKNAYYANYIKLCDESRKSINIDYLALDRSRQDLCAFEKKAYILAKQQLKQKGGTTHDTL